MTKKQKLEKETEVKNLENKVNSMLIMALGFSVDSTGIVRDQDTMNNIIVLYKNLKYTTNPSQVQLHRNDILFDMVNNYKLASTMFDAYLSKLEKEQNIYILNYYFDINSQNLTNACRITLPDSIIKSQWYHNPMLGAIECILYFAYGDMCKISVDDLKRLDVLKHELQQ